MAGSLTLNRSTTGQHSMLAKEKHSPLHSRPIRKGSSHFRSAAAWRWITRERASAELRKCFLRSFDAESAAMLLKSRQASTLRLCQSMMATRYKKPRAGASS
jgi:hypothetical protein